MSEVYLSDEGASELAAIRVGDTLVEVTDGRAPIELLARVPSDECGCPEELWRIDGAIYLIHMEAEAGTGEIFAYYGDDEHEWPVRAETLDHLRAQMFERHAAAQPT
ncbi:hypothetical protein KZZ07_14235 [Mameliella sp. CS4]|uniref:hypothetical protein n=1 Tax=Mameliella sp. CS4 TaxID=2862329 RepID=UPI000840FE0E|nr:hypothetical protein [Mameliella sp. CS4]MBW4983701.1 hypothetical protein [Mameliella sp. CS4]ODM49112.1 hypothetical protein A9320_17770 [Ruegeria sp. PBVC088]